jgi:hypothetical protein
MKHSASLNLHKSFRLIKGFMFSFYPTFLTSLQHLPVPLSHLLHFWCYKGASQPDKLWAGKELQIAIKRFGAELEWARVQDLVFM